MVGVHVGTLRRWEREGRFLPRFRTTGGHRRYLLSLIFKFMGQDRPLNNAGITIGYARVSSHDQKDDLERQKTRLMNFMQSKGWSSEVLCDLGSGLNYKKRGLKILLGRIMKGEIKRLVLTHKDRLLRFGSEIIFALCDYYGTEVVIIDESHDQTYEESWAKDVLEIITVFSARLYGSRSHKNKKTVV